MNTFVKSDCEERPDLRVSKVDVPERDVALDCGEGHSGRVVRVNLRTPVQDRKDRGDRVARLAEVGAHGGGLGDADGAQHDGEEHLGEKKSRLWDFGC